MPRILAPSAAFVIVLGLSVTGLTLTPALAQSASGGTSKSAQTVQSKMRNAEEPSSPEKQQAAAKQADCKKQAKAQKLSGAKRRAFLKDCTKT
jgi:hypothetical protein